MFPAVWHSFIFASSLLEHMIVPLFGTHYQTNTYIHTISPFFFALSPLSLPSLSYSANAGCMCQWHTVVLCGGPTSDTQLCLTRVLRSSIDIDRTSLCESESVPLTVSLFFLEHIPICESLFLFSLPLFCILICFCQSAVLSSVDRLHMERSIHSPLQSVYSLPCAIL